MNWQYVLVTLSLFSAALISTSLALFAWLRRIAAWSAPFAILMLAVAQWSLGYALELGATDLQVKLFWAQVQYLGIVVTPVAWFLFAVRYIGLERWLQRRYVTLLSLIPILTLLLVFTNDAHGLVWGEVALDRNWPFIMLEVERGPWFWVFVAYSYLLTLGGTLFLYRALRRQFSRPFGWSFYPILLSPLLPWVGNILYLAGLSPIEQIDFTPVAFSISGVLIGWAILRHHLFDLVPVARQTVLDSMSDGVLVTNVQERIADINPAAETILGKSADRLVGYPLTEVLPEWAGHWQEARRQGVLDTEITLEQGEARHYNLRITPLFTSRQQIGGHLLVLRDITQRKQAEAESASRQRLFANLVAVARATAEGPSLQATLQNALEVATSLTEAEYGSLFLLDSAGRVTNSILARGKTGPSNQRKIVGRVMDKGLAGWVVRHRQAALVQDTTEDDRWLTLPDQPYAVRSVLAVPITSGPEVPGVLTLQHSRPHHFDEAHAQLMRAASDQMALALRNAQMYETQRGLAGRQLVLYEALTRIGEHLEPDTMLHVAVETIGGLTAWPAIAILVAEGDRLRVKAASGLLAGAEGRVMAAGSGLGGAAFQSGTTRLVRDISASDEYIGHFPQLRSALYVPLRHGQERLGVFAIERTEVDGFGDDDIWLAESLAEALGLAMANARLFQAVADEHGRLQALIEASRDGIIFVGTNRRLLVVNQRAVDFLGLGGDPEAWINQPLAEALARLRHQVPDVVRTAIGEMRRIRRGDEALAEGEFLVAQRALQWATLPVTTGEQRLGWLIVLQDVTRERTLQRMRDDLTHTMVHDLRNPLNVVSSGLAMMADQIGSPAPDNLGEILEISQNSTQRMLSLVNGILSISRLEDGQMPLMRQSLQLSEVLEQVLAGQRPLAREKELVLLNGNHEGPLPRVSADPQLLERVLQNLLGNAIKFTPAGGTISVRAQARPGAVQVSVKDTGPGIPRELQGQLFEKFVTGEQQERGSGLGLTFCRMAIEAHGGEIWVESRPGQGATFAFTLPTANSHPPRTQPDT